MGLSPRLADSAGHDGFLHRRLEVTPARHGNLGEVDEQLRKPRMTGPTRDSGAGPWLVFCLVDGLTYLELTIATLWVWAGYEHLDAGLPYRLYMVLTALLMAMLAFTFVGVPALAVALACLATGWLQVLRGRVTEPGSATAAGLTYLVALLTPLASVLVLTVLLGHGWPDAEALVPLNGIGLFQGGLSWAGLAIGARLGRASCPPDAARRRLAACFGVLLLAAIALTPYGRQGTRLWFGWLGGKF